LTVDKFSFGTLLSPVGMTLTNIALTTSVGIWAWRRSGEPRRNSDESRTEPKGE
jgi:hypothetical protein